MKSKNNKGIDLKTKSIKRIKQRIILFVKLLTDSFKNGIVNVKKIATIAFLSIIYFALMVYKNIIIILKLVLFIIFSFIKGIYTRFKKILINTYEVVKKTLLLIWNFVRIVYETISYNAVLTIGLIIILILSHNFFMSNEKSFSLVFVKEANSTAVVLFSSIVTLSVLSITILSIVIQSKRTFFGIPFSKYSSYKNYQFKISHLLLLSFISIFISIFMLLQEDVVRLTYCLIFVMGLVTLYSLGFFLYLSNDKLISRFLKKKSTLKYYGIDIIKSAYLFFLEDFNLKGHTHNEDLVNFINEIRKKLEL